MTFTPTLLPLEVKLDMCRELLVEFGARKVRVRRDAHEIEHCCVLPWHDENHPSASLNYSKMVYSCLGCQSSGGLLWFIAMCREGADGRSARDWLDGKTGQSAEAELPDLIRLIKAIYEQEKPRVEPLPKMSPRALDPWRKIHPWLTLPTNAPPPGPGRGIPRQNVIDLELGYARRFPVRVDDDDDAAAGGEPRYVESERIVIPHFWRGSLVGWQTRRLADDGTPKYVSSTGDWRGRTLYRHDPRRRLAIVVESPMSVARHFHHLPMVATFGAKVTRQQILLLAEYETVLLWMDNDDAGWRAVQGWVDPQGERHPGLAEGLAPYSEVLVVPSDWAADPADMDDESARELVLSATSYVQWRPPEVLRCWTCRSTHEGRCAA
jgi:hypothetical protein